MKKKINDTQNLYQITAADEKVRIEAQINQLKAELSGGVISSPTPDTTVGGSKPADTIVVSPDQKPISTIPDNPRPSLPANLSEAERDKLAAFPFLEKRI